MKPKSLRQTGCSALLSLHICKFCEADETRRRKLPWKYRWKNLWSLFTNWSDRLIIETLYWTRYVGHVMECFYSFLALGMNAYIRRVKQDDTAPTSNNFFGNENRLVGLTLFIRVTIKFIFSQKRYHFWKRNRWCFHSLHCLNSTLLWGRSFLKWTSPKLFFDWKITAWWRIDTEQKCCVSATSKGKKHGQLSWEQRKRTTVGPMKEDAWGSYLYGTKLQTIQQKTRNS